MNSNEVFELFCQAEHIEEVDALSAISDFFDIEVETFQDIIDFVEQLEETSNLPLALRTRFETPANILSFMIAYKIYNPFEGGVVLAKTNNND